MDIRDIPDTLEELITWSRVGFTSPSIILAQREGQAYQETHMVPADTNKEVAGYTVEELLSFVPETFGMKALSRRIVICLMEDFVRESMLYVPLVSIIVSNHPILLSSQISRTAMASPHLLDSWYGISCFLSAVVPFSTFP